MDLTNNYPRDRKYHPEHTWVKIEDDIALIGISHYAQEQLREVLFCELPSVGEKFKVGQTFGVVESAKVASDLIAPLGGEIVDVNEKLEDEPELLNEDPNGDGWLVKIKIDTVDVDVLVDADEYSRDK